MSSNADKRPRLAVIGAVALCLTVGISAGAEAAKKKGKKEPGSVDITKAVNQAVPDQVPGGLSGLLTSTIDVGKQFKGKRIRDVNVQLQTVGTGNGPNDLGIRLTSPGGGNVFLLGGPALSGALLGPVTFDDETEVLLISGGTPNGSPVTLFPPYQGSVQPQGNLGTLNKTLGTLDNGPVQGTWTLSINDFFSTVGNTNTLVFWRLQVAAGKPYLTK